jgi:hypothetical protein
MMLRLRLMQRLGLLGPILRAHRRIEAWAATEPAPRSVVRANSRVQA